MIVFLRIIGFIMSPIGRYVAIGMTLVALWGANSIYFYRKGENHVQAKWDAAVQAAAEQAERARSDAESSVEREPAGGLRNHDKYDRDAR